MNEQDLITDAASGNVHAFGQLIMPYEKPIYNFCRRMLGDDYDAQDVSQEIFIRVYKNIKKYRTRSGASFKSWLYAIANNACIDELRKRKSRIRPESLDAAFESDDGEAYRQLRSPEELPEEAVIKKERQKIIAEAVSNMPASFRQMIVLRDIRGFGYEEIAEITGMKLGTVKSKISRARQYLAEQLQKIYV